MSLPPYRNNIHTRIKQLMGDGQEVWSVVPGRSGQIIYVPLDSGSCKVQNKWGGCLVTTFAVGESVELVEDNGRWVVRPVSP